MFLHALKFKTGAPLMHKLIQEDGKTRKQSLIHMNGEDEQDLGKSWE